MKTKSLLLAFAGLGLFACTNEDLKNDIEGVADVAISINGVGSRAGGETQDVDVETITMTLSASSVAAGQQMTKTFTTEEDGQTALEQANAWKWTEVRNPRSITVSVNGGKAEKYTLDEIKGVGYKAPLYGTTSTYTTTDDGGTKLYTYSLTLTNDKIARVEFSNISHGTVDHGSLGCYFSQINWNGIFLNDIKLSSDAEDPTHYDAWAGDLPLSQTISGSFIDWTSADATYAWNIFPGTPKLTFSFKEIQLAGGIVGGNTFVGGNGYATVTGYQTSEGAPITEFSAGNIYKITDIVIEDSYIGGTPDPTKPVNVKAVITVTPWNIVNGTVTWN